VRLERGPDYVSLVIQDWGLRFQDTPEGADRGLGLVSMGEWVRLVNGALNIQISPGEGTTVTLSIPC
jgi:signal transduction histidine kinase